MSYKKGDYQKYSASEEAKNDRVARNRNRRRAIREGLVKKGDGKEIDHVDGNPQNNAKSNLRVVSRHYNRVKQ